GSARGAGCARVYAAVDGRVCAETPGGSFLLHDGRADPLESLPDPGAAGARRFQNRDAVLADGRKVSVDLPERRLVVTEASGEVSHEVALTFVSGGAIITSLGLGPDGCIYGSTAHP